MAGLDSLDASRDFVDRHGLGDLPHAFDADGAIWSGFGTITRSAFIFLDDGGTSDSTSYGVLGEDGLNRRIDALLAS